MCLFGFSCYVVEATFVVIKWVGVAARLGYDGVTFVLLLQMLARVFVCIN